MFVGAETYNQHAEDDDGRSYTPRRLVSEFALVKAGKGDTWVGYRDVVEVNGSTVVDRRDRLLRLLTSPSADAAQVKQIADEGARYNIGPISRNFNVPTTVLLFFDSSSIGRFTFERKGTKQIEGATTWELQFKETARPTLVRTKDGRDVPCEGRIWVVPEDGTVVRTQIELRNFADQRTTRETIEKEAPPPPVATSPPPTPSSTTGGTGGSSTAPAPPPRPTAMPSVPPRTVVRTENVRIESVARIEVTYHLEKTFGVWLPMKMSELYEGALPAATKGVFTLGRTTGVAEYANFKRFAASAKIVDVK